MEATNGLVRAQGGESMKFPYGISDFKKIITKGYFYCDRTDKIPLLEQSDSQLFIRPRRFGKSLVLSMLENYYDVAKADEFDEIFGNLAIGKNPTKLRNSYFILRWDFSCVDTTGSVKEIKQALYDHINFCIKGFLLYYRDYNLPEVEVDRDNCINSINSLISSVRMTPYPIYLLIDEYDNLANTIMMGVQDEKTRYDALVHDEGILSTLFKAIKSSTSGSMFDRVFITGVSPVVLSDITSGYNIAENIYFHQKFNDLCGFRENEAREVVEQIVAECDFGAEKADEALDLMKTYYNGYLFAFGLDEYIYNPTLCLYFFKQFQEMCSYPREMLDDNLATDESKLEYIAQLSNGQALLVDLTQKAHEVVVSKVSKRFGIKEMLSDTSKDNTFLASFLYYFGVLTLAGENPEGDVILKVPNLVIQSLYVERVQKMLLPEPGDRDDGRFAAKQVYQKGIMQPLCDFVEHRYFTVFKNRDYRWANELTLKTAFLTLLYNDILYVMDSEPEIDRRYADLTMIIRPDKRHFKIFDVLIEFKFVTLKDAGITGEQAGNLSETALRELPQMPKALNEGREQARSYSDRLEKKYGNLRLKRFVVASLGFERICFEAVGN
ncbi:MAG: AAA family ATPase [Thermodesulfobacteriota bacterium]|nr:AAA family ATPase [Thermodesulfobacteriota bacterium]